MIKKKGSVHTISKDKKPVNMPAPVGDAMDYKGLCPICAQTLPVVGGVLKCSDHYEIEKKMFEGAWDKYDKSKDKTEAGKALITFLMQNNVAVNGPKVEDGNWIKWAVDHRPQARPQ